jgi:hypothetical protein
MGHSLGDVGVLSLLTNEDLRVESQVTKGRMSLDWDLNPNAIPLGCEDSQNRAA